VYRVQLDLMSLVRVMGVVGFGVGTVVGAASLVWGLMAGAAPLQAIFAAVLSPFTNGAIMAVFGLVGYPFYNWFCTRNRGLVLSGRFLELTPKDIPPSELSD
jgi:membrane associated rhomboid family serine protease